MWEKKRLKIKKTCLMCNSREFVPGRLPRTTDVRPSTSKKFQHARGPT